jgi:hypothetical protein
MQKVFEDLLAIGSVTTVVVSQGSPSSVWESLGIAVPMRMIRAEERRQVFADAAPPAAAWGSDPADDDEPSSTDRCELHEVVISPARYSVTVPMQLVGMNTRMVVFLLSTRSALAIDSMYRLLGNDYLRAVVQEYEEHNEEFHARR